MPSHKKFHRFLLASLIACAVLYLITIFTKFKVSLPNSLLPTLSEASQKYVTSPEFETFFDQTLSPPGVLMKSNSGIGNRLFLYACSYALAKDKKLPLYVFVPPEEFNLTRDFNPALRRYSLDQFSIPKFKIYGPTTVTQNVTIINGQQLLDRTVPEIDKGFYKISEFEYCQSQAYWYKYTDDIKRILQPSENVVASMSNNVTSVLRDIRTSDSVAVHVRRGDYLTARGGAFFVPISYQRSAIRRMLKILEGKNISSPVFFVFSDDIQYAKRQLSDFEKQHRFVYVSELKTQSIEDLYLMIQCKHLIIPNSTFSWWAAFLNSNKNKTVIASAHNPELWREKERAFIKFERGQLFHPSDWMIINPFAGEQ